MANVAQYDPTNPTPYQAPELPPLREPSPSPIPAPETKQFSVAPTKAGGVASVLDSVMRGIMAGRAQAQEKQAKELDRTDKTNVALYTMAAQKLQGTIAGAVQKSVKPEDIQKLMQNPNQKPEGMTDEDFKLLHDDKALVDNAWGKVKQFRVSQWDDGKKKKGGKKQDEMTPQQKAQSPDPATKREGIIEMWSKMPPPVYGTLLGVAQQAHQAAQAIQLEDSQFSSAKKTKELMDRREALLLKSHRGEEEDGELQRLTETLSPIVEKEKWKKLDMVDESGQHYPYFYNEDSGEYKDPSGKVSSSIPPGLTFASTAKKSAEDQDKELFAKSISKPVSEWGWNEEGQFYKSRYDSKNPYASKRMALAGHASHLADLNYQLRRSETNLKDFLAFQKQLAPMDKIETTASAADDYISNPTGPGDVALTLAFFEVAKDAAPGSGAGIRFTQQEQKLIQGSRGWADAATANAERWGSGTLYDDTQRKQMASIIKSAADKMKARREAFLSGAEEFNPDAVSAVGSSSLNRKRITPGVVTQPAPAGSAPKSMPDGW